MEIMPDSGPEPFPGDAPVSRAMHPRGRQAVSRKTIGAHAVIGYARRGTAS